MVITADADNDGARSRGRVHLVTGGAGYVTELKVPPPFLQDNF
jgi:hypothetical protein